MDSRILAIPAVLGVVALVATALRGPPDPPRSPAPPSLAESPARSSQRTTPSRESEPVLPPGGDLAECLARVHGETPVRFLEHWALEARDPRVRRDAATRLVDLLGSGARTFLLARIADSSESAKVRAACARLLGRAGKRADLEAILEGDEAVQVRAGAAAGLVWKASEEPVKGSLEEILRGNEKPLRDAVASEIAAAPLPSCDEMAVRFSGNGAIPEDARSLMIRSLGARRVAMALPHLERTVTNDHESPEVRAAAIRALGHLGLPEGRRTLQGLEDDPSPVVRRESAIARQRLGRRAAEAR